MKKSFFIALIIFNFVFVTMLLSKVIAEVGSYKITTRDLNEKIYQLPDTLVYRKQIAYSMLVDDNLLLNYALQNDITVSENELDDFFISQLGDDESLQTNGEFDYDKYLRLKNSERGKRILDLMKKDILIKKSKDLIIESFELTDQKLLDYFIINSLKVDLDYAILNINSLDVSKNCTPNGAIEYFYDNRNKYLSDSGKIYRFVVESFKDFADSAKVYTQKKLAQIPDSLLSENSAEQDSLKNNIFYDILDSLTYQAAINDYKFFRSSWDDSLRYYETYPIEKNKKFDDFPDTLLSNMSINDVALPFKTDYGYVTVKYQQKMERYPLPLNRVKSQVWKSYKRICNTNEELLKEYYKTHIDSFFVNASMVDILKLPKKTKKIFEYQKKFFDEQPFKYTKKIKNVIIFLEKFKNKEPVYDLIANKIKQSMEKGVIEYNDNYYIFKENLNFPDYLPDFDDIKKQIANVNIASIVDTSLIKKYYEENKRNMISPDSVKLGFAFFSYKTDTLKVDEKVVEEYYNAHKSEFQRETPSILVDYIALPDSLTAYKIINYLNRGDEFDFVKYLYNVGCKELKNGEISYKAMNDTIKKFIDDTPLKSYSEPFYFRNKWIVLYKEKFYNKKQKTFDEVKKQIENKFKLQKAKTIAYNEAKTVFDSVRYFADCLKYVDKKNIYKTKFQRLDKPFDILGDMTYYKDELMRIWKNVKLTSIVQADSGYAVVFLLKKKPSKKLSYEEAKSKIIRMLYEEKKNKKAIENAKLLRAQIIGGANPDSLLFFFGNWYSVTNLKLNSLMPGLDKKLSSLILIDVSKHQQGYVSPVLKLDLTKLIFYKINKLEKISRKEFYKNRSKIKSELITKKLREWLDNYKKKVNIKFYGF